MWDRYDLYIVQGDLLAARRQVENALEIRFQPRHGFAFGGDYFRYDVPSDPVAITLFVNSDGDGEPVEDEFPTTDRCLCVSFVRRTDLDSQADAIREKLLRTGVAQWAKRVSGD